MPSDFANRRPPARRKTLADLLRNLQDGPTKARPSFTTSPVAGPGRIREMNGSRQERNRETEIERRRRLAQDALRHLKGR